MGLFRWVDLVLVVMLPLAVWWVAGGGRSERDVREHWFPIGAACYALAVALAVLSPKPLEPLTTVVIRTLFYGTTFMMSEYFLLLLGRGRLPLIGWVMVGAGVGLASVALSTSGSPRAGDLLHHVFLASIQLRLCTLLVRLWWKLRSRGAMSIAVAIAIIVVANCIQIASLATAGRLISPSVSSVESSLLYLANLSCVVLFSLGYLALRAELAKGAEVRMAESRAEEEGRRRAAEALVADRNRLILTQSRFEARNNLAIFNAAVVHEISQPLQKLALDAALLARHTALPEELKAPLQEINRDVGSMVGIVHSLRELMSDVSPRLKVVQVRGVVSPLRAIAEAEAKRRGIRLTIDDSQLDESDAICADSVLFGRVILNLITNAFNSLASREQSLGRSVDELWVVCEFRRAVDRSHPVIIMDCRDNGIGPPAEFDATLETVVQSSVDGGMGIGLILVKQLVSVWKGTLSVRVPEQGLEVSVSLPRVTFAPG